MGLIKDVDVTILNECMVFMQPGFLQKYAGTTLNTSERDMFRAKLLRERLQNGRKKNNKRRGTCMMFNRFTQRSQKVLQLAQEEAIRLKHESIGTEHILLGLIREGSGIAAKALEAIEVDPKVIEAGVEELVGTGTEDVGPIVHYTPRAKKVIELSVDESRKLGHSYIGTEHLLLALIREGEGVAARVLNNSGVSLNKARQQVLQLLGSTDQSHSNGS